MQSNLWRTLLRVLVAIIVGNLIYYLLLAPYLPLAARHQRGRVDIGLVIDFVICLAIWGGSQLGVRRSQ